MSNQANLKLSEETMEDKEWKDFVQEMNEGYIDFLKRNNHEDLLNLPLPVSNEV